MTTSLKTKGIPKTLADETINKKVCPKLEFNVLDYINFTIQCFSSHLTYRFRSDKEVTIYYSNLKNIYSEVAIYQNEKKRITVKLKLDGDKLQVKIVLQYLK